MDFQQPFGGLITGANGTVLSVLLRTSTPLTGRQIHTLTGNRSLWSTQQALASLQQIGLIDVTTVGKANLHTINPDHYAIAPLRILLDPIAALRETVNQNIDKTVQTVLLFGSVARGEATPQSDIDLAVIAPQTWPGRINLQTAITKQLGNNCDVLVFTLKQFAANKEPVIKEIMRDGITIHGTKPHNQGKPS